MIRRANWLVFSGLLVVLAGACSEQSGDEGDSCKTGSERCACYPNDTCDQGLSCRSNRCIDRRTAGQAGAEDGGAPDGGSGSPSAGETSNASGGRSGAGGSAPTPAGGSSGRATGGFSTGGTAPAGGRDAAGAGDSNSAGTPSNAGAVQGGSSSVGGASSGGAEPLGGSDSGAAGSDAAGSPGSGGAGAEPGRVLFFDDFDDGDAAGWASSEFIEWTAEFESGTNFVFTSLSEGFVGAATAGDPAWTDQFVEVRFKMVEVTDLDVGIYAVVGARAEGVSNGCFVYVWGDGGFSLLDRVGTDQQRQDANVSLAADEWHTIGIRALGTVVTAFYDGVEVAEIENAQCMSGGVALTFDNGYGRLVYDDVSVREP